MRIIMWKQFKWTIIPSAVKFNSRSFLSDAFKCTDSWNARLSSPVFEKIKLEPFYYELDQKFQQGKASAIDVDIFANKMTDDFHIEELADILHKLRMTEETSNALDSTGHALIRSYLEHNHITELLDILNDRLSYGVFLDSYAANLALDKLLKAKDYISAAKIASLMMLQEDFENSITKSLSLYACLKYLETPQKFEEAPQIVQVVTPPPSKKKVEVRKIRVKFIRNPYFDDHFDLNDSNLLVGKTLVMIGKTTNGILGNSVQLLGYCFYQKYDEGYNFLKTIGDNIHRDAVILTKKHLVQVKNKDNNAALNTFFGKIEKIETSSNLTTDNLEDTICKLVNETVMANETKDIAEQKKVYSEWIDLRQQKLTEELNRLNRVRRLSVVEKLTQEMAQQEQKLWFFENEDKIDLQIDSKKIFYRKRWFGKIKKPRVIDQGYVPPDVDARRN